MLEHTKVLASDEFEGRGPGTKGETLTVEYLTKQLRAIGLAPGNPDGSWVQPVPLVGTTVKGAPALVFRKGGEERKARLARRLRRVDEAGRRARLARRLRARLRRLRRPGARVPVGRLQGRRPSRARRWSCSSAIRPSRTRRRPASSTRRVRRPGDDLLRPLDLQVRDGREDGRGGCSDRPRDGAGRLPVRGGAGEGGRAVRPRDEGRQRRALGGRGLDQRRAGQGALRHGRPGLRRAQEEGRDAPVHARAARRDRVGRARKRHPPCAVGERRREARGRATPPLRDEYVVYTTHWDHFGIGPAVDGDRIYRGALDNASGTAGLLEIARALAQAEPRPRRSILFLFVTGEEQGLLGSTYYATHPLYPLAKTLAVLNLDGLNVAGRTKDLTIVGLGLSTLDDTFAACRRRAGPGRSPRPDAREGLLLPLRPLPVREGGRALGPRRRRHGVRRQAGRLTGRRSARTTSRTTTTSRRTRSRPTGT